MERENIKGFLEFVYDFYKTMKAHEISLVYEGEITHQITKAFTSLAESNMLKEDEATNVQKKVFHVMVECLQNISKHAEDYNDNKDFLYAGRGIFMVSKGEKEYHITTGNVVENIKISELSSALDSINKLDKEELKELYKKQMKERRLSEKGGAGLGLIDIRRKTSNELLYHFLPISDSTSFFLLTSTISRSDE
jgi:hypothetical protein